MGYTSSNEYEYELVQSGSKSGSGDSFAYELTSWLLQYLSPKELSEINKQTFKELREKADVKPQKVSAEDIKKAYKERFGDAPNLFMDKHYWAVTKEELEKVAELLWQDQKQYVKEHFDCEDFSRAWVTFCSLLGITAVSFSTGKVVSGDKKVGHAYSFVYTTDDGVYLFESETDQMSKDNKINNWEYKTFWNQW